MTALLAEGQPADEALVRRISTRLRGLAGSDRKNARTLAIAAARGIDPESAGLEALLALLHFEDNPDRGGYRRRRMPRGRREPGEPGEPGEPEQAEAVRSELARESGDDALGLFNALRPAGNEAGHWIAIPFSFNHEGRDLCGTARFLLERPSSPRPVRMALEIRGRSLWSFALSGPSGARRLEVFAEDGGARRRAVRSLAALRAKLQNHGVEVDDSISDASLFDGYSTARASGRVDLVG
jgi:hypothetical protein